MPYPNTKCIWFITKYFSFQWRQLRGHVQEGKWPTARTRVGKVQCRGSSGAGIYPDPDFWCSSNCINQWFQNSDLSMICGLRFFLPRCMECRRGLAIRILSVCPSVRPSVCVCVYHTRELWQNGRKICPDLYTIRKNIYRSFLRRRMVGGAIPST